MYNSLKMGNCNRNADKRVKFNNFYQMCGGDTVRDKNRIYLPRGIPLMLRYVSLAAALCVLLSGCSGQTQSPVTENTTAPVETTVPAASSADLYCLEVSTYSGPFVEDGSEEEVENVAAIIVENRSAQYLERAVITYVFGDDVAQFELTGLPSGCKAVVLEKDRLVLSGKESYTLISCDSTFRSDAITESDTLKAYSKGNVLRLENTSEETHLNTCVYYKKVNSDGSFLGGITYMLSFDTMKPGESKEKASAHFTENCEIVRFSYQTE